MTQFNTQLYHSIISNHRFVKSCIVMQGSPLIKSCLNKHCRCTSSSYVRGSIKKYKDNVAVYHIFFIKVKTNRLIYATIFILLIHKVSFHLMKRYFCYPILKSTCFVTTAQGNVENMASR